MKSLPSVMQHKFSQVPRAEIPRSSFDRSHGYKTTFDAGLLIPFFVDEAVPGDTFNYRATLFARLATPLKPVMDNMFLETFFFAVPLRLVWTNFQKFMGEQTDPGDSTDYTIPICDSTGRAAYYGVHSMFDYMGIPIDLEGIVHSALWPRAYELIWNEWFRDQNLQDSFVVPKGDGPDDPAVYVLQRRGKRHDYFTSCLPWPQKGPSVELPLGTSAPVVSDGGGFTLSNGTDTRALNSSASSNQVVAASNWTVTAQLDWGDPGLQADLSTATAATINQLREAFQVQKLYERDARGGTRYTEIVRSHFGVVSPDARLQRPEYLGGGSSPVVVNPVVQQSATDTGTSSQTPQGNLAGYGTVTAHGHGFTKSFTEHCVVIGLLCVRADLNYQQGLHRMWSRSTRFDFYWPALARIGEQAVLSKEIYADGTANDEDVFGYQERYAEMRYKNSLITGLFRSQASGSLDIWHLAQEFGTRPVLDSTFIVENPPVDRVIVVPSEPHFMLDGYAKYICARPMPVYGVPGMIDHF